MKTVFGVIALLVFSSCGDGSSNDTVAGYCASVCGLRGRCGDLEASDTQATCTTACESEGGPLASTFKPGVLGYMGTCLDGLACGVNQATCTTQVLGKVNPNWSTDPDYLACADRESACAGQSSSDVSVGFQCEFFILRTGTVTSGLKACLALECAAIGECIRWVIDPDGH